MDKILYEYPIKPALLVSWPRHLDFPLWRQQLRGYRRRFSDVVVVFTNMNVGEDYRTFIIKAMEEDKVNFIYDVYNPDSKDWRDAAVNAGLKSIMDNKWIFFTEQDFFYKRGFWEDVYNQADKVSYIRALVGDRVHPACIFITEELLSNKTSKNFGVIKDVSDHFSIFTNELANEPHYDIPEKYWLHLGGLSQNMYMLMQNKPITYMPEEFAQYALECLNVTVPTHEDFDYLFTKYLTETWGIL